MKIYLIRHGNAIDAGSADHEEDSQRVLTEMGCEKMKNIAAALKTLGVKPDLIVSSPYARSIQTTQILKKALEYKRELAAHFLHGIFVRGPLRYLFPGSTWVS